MSFTSCVDILLLGVGILILMCFIEEAFAAQSDDLFTCGFEHVGYCSMKHGRFGAFQWTDRYGPLHQSSGPRSAYSGDYYMLLDVKSNYPSKRAIIKTAQLGYSGVVCVSFAYHMYGRDTGSLKVKTTVPYEIIFIKEGEQGYNWTHTQLDVNITLKSRIRFEGRTGNGPLGNIALDEIHVTRGSCESQDNEICDPVEYNCPGGQRCEADGDVYRCSCEQGYDILNGGNTCQDIDECATDQHGCSQLCTNTIGSYHCTCRTGYNSKDGGRTCQDINECLSGPCDHTCINTQGSYRCSCHSGYLQRNGFACICIDYCEAGLHDCSQRCINIVGTYRCMCDTGYSSTDGGRTCQECVPGTFGNGCNQECHCVGEESCDVTTGACPMAGCADGYTGDTCSEACSSGRFGHGCRQECYCADGEGCDVTTGICPSAACADGFTGDTCSRDIDECATDQHACSQLCTNAIGSYYCACAIGYILHNGGRCEEIKYCESGLMDCSQRCIKMGGTYRCMCDTGYSSTDGGRTCQDIDECATEIHGCPQQCTNTVGGYRCTCDTGYNSTDGGNTCQECVPGTFGDGCNQECHCVGEEACDVTTGACPMAGCADGYTGDTCSEACSSGRFGHGCRQECHCADGEGCDVTTGICHRDAAMEGHTRTITS